MNKSTLTESCHYLLKKIPKNKVTTYKELSRALNTKAYRAIGQILKKNHFPETIPCYKVIKSNGELGGYFGSSLKNIKKKINLLKKDHINIRNNKVNLKEYLYRFD